MIEWFDSLSVYLKPLPIFAATLIMVAIAGTLATISVSLSEMKQGKKRTLAKSMFYGTLLVLLYILMAWIFSCKP